MRNRYAWSRPSRVLMLGCAAAAALSGTGAAAQSPSTKRPMPLAPTGTLAFVDVTLVPMDTERILPGHAVVVQNGRIAAIGPMNRIKVPRTATRIDGRGKYLIPGLAEMHAHLMFGGTSEGRPTDTSAARRAERNVERLLLGFLAQGVTTIRNMDYANRAAGETVLALRSRAAAGTLLSPRIYTAGPWMSTQDYVRFEWNTDTSWRIAPADIATRIATYKAAGYDFLKLYYESPKIFDSIVTAARRLGLPIAGHVPFLVPIEHALAAQVHSIEHLTGYMDYAKLRTGANRTEVLGKLNDQTQLGALAEATRRAGTWNCPTLVVVENMLHQMPGSSANDYPYLPAMRRFVKALQDAGAGLLLGTDAGGIGNPGVVEELQALTRAGLTPYQALATGTRNVAAYFGTFDSTGTITTGKRADLVLLNGNPLQNVQHVAMPTGTMLGGRWLPRDELDRHLTGKGESPMP